MRARRSLLVAHVVPAGGGVGSRAVLVAGPLVLVSLAGLGYWCSLFSCLVPLGVLSRGLVRALLVCGCGVMWCAPLVWVYSLLGMWFCSGVR